MGDDNFGHPRPGKHGKKHDQHQASKNPPRCYSRCGTRRRLVHRASGGSATQRRPHPDGQPGRWTLGCYGNPDIRTPHIDRLAREGTLFERCYSSNAVCSPTRATLLTGLIPSQHGVHSYLSAGDPQIGPTPYSTIAEFRTLPEILAEAGYVCGLSGKWHLGDNLQPQEGFTYWVTMPHGHTTTFYDADVIEDGKVRKEPGLPHRLLDRPRRRVHRAEQGPAVLFVPGLQRPVRPGREHVARRPQSPRRLLRRQGAEVVPAREDASLAASATSAILNNPVAMRRYAAEVSGVDDGVGRILDALEKHNLDDNTLVIFTADKGLAGGQGGFWGMGDHTRPLTAFDATMHVPLIYRHPGRIPAGKRSEPAGQQLRLSADAARLPRPEGQDAAETATRPATAMPRRCMARHVPWDDVVFFEYEDTRAVRTTEWKYIHRFPDGPNELYDLKTDPGERNNLVDQPAHAEMQKDLKRAADEVLQATTPTLATTAAAAARRRPIAIISGRPPQSQPLACFTSPAVFRDPRQSYLWPGRPQCRQLPGRTRRPSPACPQPTRAEQGRKSDRR